MDLEENLVEPSWLSEDPTSQKRYEKNTVVERWMGHFFWGVGVFLRKLWEGCFLADIYIYVNMYIYIYMYMNINIYIYPVYCEWDDLNVRPLKHEKHMFQILKFYSIVCFFNNKC